MDDLINSEAIQSHLTILQSIIQRMASNSASSKAWSISLVSAILVVVADKSKPEYAIIAIIPIILFMVLDAYYLGLEKGFRDSYNSFIKKIHTKEIKIDDLFSVKPEGNVFKLTFLSLQSFSVYPFYITLFIMILIIKNCVL